MLYVICCNGLEIFGYSNYNMSTVVEYIPTFYVLLILLILSHRVDCTRTRPRFLSPSCYLTLQSIHLFDSDFSAYQPCGMFVAPTEMGEVYTSGRFLHQFLHICVCLIVESRWFLACRGSTGTVIEGRALHVKRPRVALSTHTVDATQHNLGIAPSGK